MSDLSFFDPDTFEPDLGKAVRNLLDKAATEVSAATEGKVQGSTESSDAHSGSRTILRADPVQGSGQGAVLLRVLHREPDWFEVDADDGGLPTRIVGLPALEAEVRSRLRSSSTGLVLGEMMKQAQNST